MPKSKQRKKHKKKAAHRSRMLKMQAHKRQREAAEKMQKMIEQLQEQIKKNRDARQEEE